MEIPVSRDSYSSVILRRQTDGSWRIVVDNSWGPAVFRMKDVFLLSTRRPTANRGACQEKTLRGGGRMGHPFLLLQDMECGLGQCRAQAAGRLSLIGA